MPTVPRSPADHYAEAERLLTVAESPTIDPGIRDLSALLVIGHALMAAAPRRARRQQRPPAARRHGSPANRWLFGDHEGGDQ